MSKLGMGTMMTSAVALVLGVVVPVAAVAAPAKAVASKSSAKKVPARKASAKKPAAKKRVVAKNKKVVARKAAPAKVVPQAATVVQVVPAPPAPPAPPAWRPIEADYQWIDNGFALLDTIGDAPPDFTFSYAGGDAWGWRTRTGHEVYAEPLFDRSGREAGVRYYYFDPRASSPFLVQDGPMAFGYRDGRMAVAYDRDGRVLSPDERDSYWSLADLLQSRGRAIRDAARYEDRWDAADAGWWAGQVPSVVELRWRWSNGRSRQPGWSKWRDRPDALYRRPGLARERESRWAAGERFQRWRQEGYRGPPPQFGTGQPGGAVKGVRPPRQGWRPGMGRPQGAAPGMTPGGVVGTRPTTGGVAGTPGTSPQPGGWTRPGMPGAGRPDGARPDRPWTQRSGGVGGRRPDGSPPLAGEPRPRPEPQADEPRGEQRPDRGQRPDGAGSAGAGRPGGGAGQRPDMPQPPAAAVPPAPIAQPAPPPSAVEPAPMAPDREPRSPRLRPGGVGGRPDWDGQPRDVAPAPVPLPAEVYVAPPPPPPAPPAPEPVYVAPPPPPPPAPEQAYVAPPPPPPPPAPVSVAPPPPPPPPPPSPEPQQREADAPQ